MRRPFLLCLLLLAAMLLSACGREAPPPSAGEVLSSMLAAMEDSVQPCPEGLIRLTAAPVHTPEHLTDTLFSALYGEAARGLLTGEAADGVVPPISDAAIFLSVAPYPCELAVLRCSDLRAAATVAGLCRSRLDTVAAGYRSSEWAEVANRGRVTVEGCYVLLVVTEDPDPVLAGGRAVLP